MSTSNSNNNDPLASTNNVKLQKLITELESIDSEPAFLQWRSSFLKVYRKNLDPDGVLNAKDANYRLVVQLSSLTACVDKVKSLITNRNLDVPNKHVTAQGRRGLTNLSNELQVCTQILESGFMPTSSSDEDRLGYDKFELASTLIEDGFHGHALLIEIQSYLRKITDDFKNADMVDDSFESIVDRFIARTKTIVDVLEDLGLYKIMRRCVDVVYKDVKKRPPPKAPEPVLEEDVVSDDDNDDDNGRGSTGENDELQQAGSAGSAAAKRGKGKKSKSKKSKSGSEDVSGTDKEGRNGSRNQGPIIRKDGKGGRSGGSDDFADQARRRWDERGEEEEKEEEEKEEEEPPPPQEGQAGEPEHLIIFDPKTNMISKISRDECGAKSQLLLDVSKEGTDAYQGMIDDDREKQEIIWLLKKLEKTKPKEESWLEAIKREKVEKAGKKISGKVKKTPSETATKKKKKKKSTSSKTDGKLASSSHSASSVGTQSTTGSSSGVRDLGDGWTGKGFRNPMAGSSKSSSSDKKKKATIENYQGMYKKSAAKPKSDGWKKVS